MDFKKITVISGHYGSGKTNISINLAFKLAKLGSVAIFDLDIVNPYFRTSDFTEQMQNAGIEVVSTIFANTNLDTPAVTGMFNNIYSGKYDYTIVDVGGDDSGAFALGQYAEGIANTNDWDHWYVVNFLRNLSSTVDDNLEMMYQIEAAGKLPYTGIVNNTNIGNETTGTTVENSFPKSVELSKRSNIPLIYTSVTDGIEVSDSPTELFKIQIHTKKYW